MISRTRAISRRGIRKSILTKAQSAIKPKSVSKPTERQKFFETLRKFNTAMLTTINASGQLHARPMAIAEIEPNGNLIFFTDDRSVKVDELTQNPEASVTCQNGWKDTVVVRGKAEVFRDTAKARRLWRKTYQTWFPDGPDDPTLIMIRVTGEQGEYWDNSGAQGIQYMFKAAKAIATRSRPEPDTVDEHGIVNL
jgi:general stress protein 26